MNTVIVNPAISRRNMIYSQLEQIKNEIKEKERSLSQDRWYKLSLYRVQHQQATNDDISIVQRHQWIEKEIADLKNQYQQICLRGI